MQSRIEIHPGESVPQAMRRWQREDRELDARYDAATEWLRAHPDAEIPESVSDEGLLAWVESQV